MTSKVAIPSTPRAGRLALWLSAPDAQLAPVMVTIFGGIGLFMGMVFVSVLSLWGLLVAAVVGLVLTLVGLKLRRAYRDLPAFPSYVFLNSETVNPLVSLRRWRELDEPARTIAIPLVEGLAQACAMFNAAETPQATAAVAQRCLRLDALHAEQVRISTTARLEAIGQPAGEDLAVGDALLEAYRGLRE